MTEAKEMIGADRGRGYSTVLASGRPFFPLDPRPEEVNINDIAHQLANQCRFCGATERFYSVAQHSVHVSMNLAPAFQLEGLLHDASEAYIGDLLRPLKPYCPGFLEIDAKIDAVIRAKYRLPAQMSPEVRLADNRMAATERRDLIRESDEVDWGIMEEPYAHFIEPMKPKEAKAFFLARYRELTKGKTFQ